jgi:uncharacterized membrane protein/protein-disulfide isomerase
MTARTRNALLAFSVLGLLASGYALYVHYRLLTDPAYVSACEVSETVSCQAVFQSQYGSMAGIPVAAGGAIWSALVLLLAAWGLKNPKSELAGSVAGYIFVLATIGLAAVFYFGYASFFVLKQACVVCMAMYVSVIGIFAITARSAAPLGTLPSRVGHDLAALGRSQTAVALAIVWLLASIGLILWFPRDPVVVAAEAGGAGEAPAQTPAVPMETLTPEQIAEWEKWLESQPQLPEALPQGDTKVLFLKFNDYQCPACRQTWALYRDIFAKYEASHPGVFKFETRDFPLELECGMGNAGHGAACEAAVAVRLAREKNRDREVEAALFARQSMSMTRDDVKTTLRDVAQIGDSEYDARYATVLEAVRADAQLGQRLGVTGTPTFFLNGIRFSTSLRPAYLEAAINWALRKAGAGS